MPTASPNDNHHLRLIESDLHFRARQLRMLGVEPPLVRALMKAAFERFLLADEGADQKAQAARPWAIYIGDREVAQHHGDPLLGHVHAVTRVEAERLAGESLEVAQGMRQLGVPLGAGYWAMEVTTS